MLDDKITLWDSTKDPGRPDLFTFGGEKHPLYKSFGRSNDPNSVFKAMITGEPRPVKMFVAVADDPLLCYEDANLTYQAMTSPNLDLVVVKDFYLSPTAQLADIVLPTADWSERCTYDEELDGPFILAFDQAVPAPGECKDDWWFWLQWGKRMNPEQWPWKDEKEMVLWRLKEFYDFDLTWEEFQEVPVRVVGNADLTAEPVYKKYEKGMLRPDGQPGFPTVTGKIEFSSPTMQLFGYDPLPDYTEPAESPYSTPELAGEYPAHRLDGASRLQLLPFRVDKRACPALLLPRAVRRHPSGRCRHLQGDRWRVGDHLLAARLDHLQGARVARGQEGRRVHSASRLA